MRTVLVAAGIVVESGKVLLSRRRSGTHLAGAWEFPGGKVEPGEDPRDALARELREELGIDAVAGSIVEATFHTYADAEKAVLLLFYEATRTATSQAPRALEVAEVKWATADELDPTEFPPADVDVLRIVRKRLTSGA
ncbi:MAG: (deoxy)nucleoside triphosphate pyrophosphohydrolase [Polyangiaceae bacterium]